MRIPVRRPVFHEHEDLENGRRRTVVWQRPVRFIESGTERPIRFALDEQEVLPGFGLCFDDIAIGGFRAFAQPGRALMTVSDVDRMLEIEPVGIRPTRASQHPGPHPLFPYLRQHTAAGVLYRNIWPGASLLYEYGGHVIQEYILLERGHPQEFRWRVRGREFGLTPRGGIKFAQIYLPPPLLTGPQLSPTENPSHIPMPLKWEIDGGDIIVRLPDGDFAGMILDPTITLQPGAADGVDSYMQEINPNTNYGSDVLMLVGHGVTDGYRQNSIVKFDYSSIPKGSRIDEMEMTLYVYAATDNSAYAYRVLVSWTEGEVTWNSRDGANNWAGGGCTGSGTDRDTSYFQRKDVPSGGSGFYTWVFSNGGQTMMQAHFENNQGILLTDDLNGTGTARTIQFATSDETDANTRPKMVVDYTPPTFGRLWAFELNPLGQRLEIVSDTGYPIPPEEIEADAWYMVDGPSLPTSELAEDLVHEKRAAYVEEIEYSDPDSASIASNTSQFADVVVARAAGRSAL